MSEPIGGTWLAGVDGCRSGWIAAFVRPVGEEVSVRIFRHFADVLAAPEAPAIVAVDIPIGLPDRIGPDGRGPERAIRPLLGARQSSVFPVPSRPAVYAEIGPFEDARSRSAAHQRACKVALATSDPPKRIPIQTFSIFPKIREVDAVLRSNSKFAKRVFETHPELAFWRLNGERPLAEPKKVKGAGNEPGLALRRHLLVAAGLPASVVVQAPPKGAGADDLLDALACAAIARRLHRETARPFPAAPARDSFGLRVAIWA
jgi:predicted RNase H-like nuclease